MGRSRMDMAFCSKRKFLPIFHSVGAEATGDWQAACEWQGVTRGQVSLRERAEANTRNEHSCLKPAELIHHDALFYPAVRTQLREPLSVFLMPKNQAGSYDRRGGATAAGA